MHFIISWDIPNTANRPQYEQQLIACFENNKYIKPLSTFYIVQVLSQTEYSSIWTKLETIGRTIPGFRMLISPSINNARYNGLLSADDWTKINEITE